MVYIIVSPTFFQFISVFYSYSQLAVIDYCESTINTFCILRFLDYSLQRGKNKFKKFQTTTTDVKFDKEFKSELENY